jgi:RimJ/RimL family protein N-acetyltransferase
MIIKGKNIILRFVSIDDAQFVLSLRLSQNESKFLAPVENDLEAQKNWLRAYKVREKKRKEFYFIICLNDHSPIGLIRLYDFRGDSFCWGSWVIKSGAPNYAGLESVLMIFEFAFEHLKFLRSHFDVIKENTRVAAFYLRLGAKRIQEDDEKFYFCFAAEDFEKAKTCYLRYYKKIEIVESND